MISEQSEQAVLARTLRSARPALLWTATANGGARPGRAGGALRSAGVQRGVPDVLIFTPPPCGRFVGAAIELKRADFRPSDVRAEQTEWIHALIGCGWWAGVCGGAAEAIAWLRTLGYRL